MSNKYGIIYKITNKINGKVYIGQTTKKYGFKARYSHKGEGIERVYKEHKHFFDENSNRCNIHLLRSIEKYGFEAFEVIEEFDVAYSKEELDKLEKKYIKDFNCLNPNGYNTREGGSHGKHSEETKKKMSEAQKGEKHWNYGGTISEEHKKAISEAVKGDKNYNWKRDFSDETRRKLSESHKGKPSPKKGTKNSEETRKKISESVRNSPNTRVKPIYCIELDKVWLTALECAKELNIDNGNIGYCCRGIRKSCGGYHFRYATEEEVEEYKNNIEKEVA